MRFGKEIKRDTQLIILSVLILTLVTLSVSYSAFFSVQSQSTVQEITTGTLNVIINDTSTGMSTEDLFPTPDADLPTSANSVIDSDYAILNLENDGNLDAEFSVTITYDDDAIPSSEADNEQIAPQYLNIGIFDVKNNSWVNFGTTDSPVYYTPLSGLTASDTNEWPILRDYVTTTDTTRQYRIYIWLSETTPTDQIGKLVYLKLDVKSTTVNGHVEG